MSVLERKSTGIVLSVEAARQMAIFRVVFRENE